MLKVVHDADASNENGTVGGSLLDEIVRDGAQAMLAAALHAEVAACIDAHAGEVDENGYRVEMPLTLTPGRIRNSRSPAVVVSVRGHRDSRDGPPHHRRHATYTNSRYAPHYGTRVVRYSCEP
jgi:hypothetical protein